MEILKEIAAVLELGKNEETAALTRRALEEGLPPRQVLDEGLIAGMNVVGQKFREHEIFLPHVLLAAKAMYAGLELLEPLLEGDQTPRAGKAVLGTVQGDLHDIGKNLVAIMLRGAGFEVVDLGSDVSPEAFVDAAVESGAGVIGMSALLTTTMPVMGKVVELLRERGLEGKIRTMVGGAPLSDEFAREIGADAYAYDGVSAVDRMRELTGAP